MKHLLSIEDLSNDDVFHIMNLSHEMKRRFLKEERLRDLEGRKVFLMFFEPSTRTRTSFEIASKMLSADVVNFSPSTSSMGKGESIEDTIKTVSAYGVDFIIVRCREEGLPKFISGLGDFCVINAGDGMNEHPTQALLDLFTIFENEGAELGKKVVFFVGDIKHSRVARSGIKLFSRFFKVCVCAPLNLLPKGIEKYAEVFHNIREIRKADYVIVLRIQKERIEENYLNLEDYISFWRVEPKDAKFIMHPGPVNVGVELSYPYSENSLILEQVRNGIAVRMATLKFLKEKRFK